ncbi:conserved hypothetical protein [delta proteobacterium NaphS2]|nr:conserved hypothetical protein [delta proteobacterium NaphS2]
MFNKAFIGVDPGKTGAAALITDEGTHEILDYPGDPSLIVAKFTEWKLHHHIVMVALEKVSARPGQGVVSMFSFGRNLGTWEGIISAFGIPFMMPTPRQWQQGLIDQKAGGDPKARSLNTARRLFPDAELSRKKDHGRADALLMAFWARRQWTN